jgi:hypothetical protein
MAEATIGTSAGPTRTVAQQEVPLDGIKDAIEKGINEVSVKVSRRNHRGQLQALVSQWAIPTADLANLDGRLGQMAGGGEYLIDSFNTMNLLERVLPPFMVRIEGAPRPADTQVLAGQMQQPQGMNPTSFGGLSMATNPFQVQHGQTPMLQGLLTPQGAQGPLPLAGVPGQPFMYPGQQPQGQPGVFGWAGGLAPQQQADYLRHYEAQLPPGASIPSDAMALKQVADMKAEVATARAEAAAAAEKLEAERAVHKEAQAKLSERLDRIEREGKDREHKLQLDLMEKKFSAQIEKMAEQSKAASEAAKLAAATPKSNPIADYVPLVAALAPVLAAMVSSGKESQAQTMQALVALSTPKPNNANMDLLKTLTPVIAPMILKFMDSRGPDAQSKAYEVLADSNMQQMAMMAQFIQTMAASQGDQSPWVPFLQQAAGGIMETIGAYMESKKQQQQPPHMIHQGQVHGLPQPPSQPPSSMGATVVQPAQQDQPQGPPSPREIVNMIMLSPQVPQEFKTQGWTDVLLSVHSQEPVEKAATVFLDHVEALMQANKLPQILSQILAHPEQVVGGLIRGLPISQINPQYAESLIAKIIEVLSQPEDGEEEADVQPFNAGPIITPAPAREPAQA